ncbi:MAG: HAD family hydrolase [candidate division WOR-3 bacterium]
MIGAVVFDLDNTLLDFNRMKEAAVSSAAEAMIDAGLGGTREEIMRGIYEVYERKGIEAQDVLNCYLDEKLGRVEYKILAAGVVAYRRAKAGSMNLFPGARYTIIELLRRGIRLGILSDAPALQAWTRLAELGLHHYFGAVVTLDDTGKRKPDPEPFRLILDRLRAQPHEAIMVGDWVERDMEGARRVGMRTAFAKYGSNQEPPYGVDYILEKISDLLWVIGENGHEIQM